MFIVLHYTPTQPRMEFDERRTGNMLCFNRKRSFGLKSMTNYYFLLLHTHVHGEDNYETNDNVVG